MLEADLVGIAAWLREPRVARWRKDPPDEDLDRLRRRLHGEVERATQMLVVSEGDEPVGWARWYWWDDYPEEAVALGARPGEAGVDFAIGNPSAAGRGVGKAMIAALVRAIRSTRPGAAVVVGLDANNASYRAVLECNAFGLVDIRPVAQAAPADPVAVYRLEAAQVWLAGVGDVAAIGRLLDEFNREFDEPTPGPEWLAGRIAALMESGDTAILVGGTGPDGLAVLRFRPSIWTAGLECYLAELYVIPDRRGLGLGRAIMDEALRFARARGADSMSIEVDEPDLGARHLYERLGFTNRDGGPDGPLMFVYEREL